MMIFFAALIGSLVFFFGGTTVVDFGYVMAQQTLMQSAADGSALGAGKLMAANVALNTNNVPVYTLSDVLIHQRALDFANANFQGGALAGSTRAIAVQYLHCDGTPAGSNSFTFSSNRDLVVQIAGSDRRMIGHVANPTDHTTPADSTSPAGVNPLGNDSSTPICMLRVYAQETHPPIFALAIPGHPANERALAQATVRIAPTTPPTVFSGVWPITHRMDGSDPPCAFTVNPSPACRTSFWGGQQDIGSFKEAVDMSKTAKVSNDTRDQLFAPNMTGSPRLDQNCGSLALFNFLPCWDNSNPTASYGTHDKSDLNRWLASGFPGQIYVPVDGDTNGPRCSTYAQAASNCPNARLETNVNGIGAGPTRTALGTAIAAGPIDPTCNCHGVTTSVLFWKYGEQNINSSTNIGTSWNDIGNPPGQNKSNDLQRVIIDKVRLFRFNTSTLGPNDISGYFVGYYNPNGTPGNGPPSAVANTVVLFS